MVFLHQALSWQHLWYSSLGQTQAEGADPCESQPHKARLTSKLNYRRFPSYLLCTFLLFPFHLLPSPVHPTGFSFCFFSGFLAIFILFPFLFHLQNMRKGVTSVFFKLALSISIIISYLFIIQS